MLAYRGIMVLLSSNMTAPPGQPPKETAARPQAKGPVVRAMVKTPWGVHVRVASAATLLPVVWRGRNCEVEKGLGAAALALLPRGLAALAKKLADMASL